MKFSVEADLSRGTAEAAMLVMQVALAAKRVRDLRACIMMAGKQIRVAEVRNIQRLERLLFIVLLTG
jgi:hypothetical protein